eukprot:scaffold910_cov370-Pavlova_lutheri.AAC.1
MGHDKGREEMLDGGSGSAHGLPMLMSGTCGVDTAVQIVSDPDGCVEFKDWKEGARCDVCRQGCIHLCEVEQDWLKSNLQALQPDVVGKWKKKTSKGKKKGKYPRRTHDDCLLMERWVCNGAESSGCTAKAILIRKSSGHLALLSKDKHDHSQCMLPCSKTKKGLPLGIRVELVKYVDSDLRVPRIMQQLEKEGLIVDGITKKMLRNFLVYQRQKNGCQGSIQDIKHLLEMNSYDASKLYQKDE